MVIGIIEDDKLLRKALDTSLQNQGYTTILAGSRKEAIKNIDSSVVNIPVRQHRKSGRRETVCPGLRKPFMRVYSRNVLSKP